MAQIMSASRTSTPRFAQLSAFYAHDFDAASPRGLSSDRHWFHQSGLGADTTTSTKSAQLRDVEDEDLVPEDVRSLSISSDESSASSSSSSSTDNSSASCLLEIPTIRRFSAYGTQYNDNFADHEPIKPTYVLQSPLAALQDDFDREQETAEDHATFATPLDGIGRVAARRALAGRLPETTLVRLHQMRIESASANIGLGVAAGTPVLDTPPATSPIGRDRQDSRSFSSNRGLAVSMDGAAGSPTSMRSSSRFSPFARSSPRPSSTTRGSPSSSGRFSPGLLRYSPSSPTLRVRSPAVRYMDDAPPLLSPLTPSGLPPAPKLGNDDFDWTTCSLAITPTADVFAASPSPRAEERATEAVSQPPLLRHASNPYFAAAQTDHRD